jgi:hypothetical protein
MLSCQRASSLSSLPRSPLLLLFLQSTTLIKFKVWNEVGLGDPDLYGGATAAAAGVGKKGAGVGAGEEPKALLEGVVVAGLVGILRQLGGRHWWPRPRFLGRRIHPPPCPAHAASCISRAGA